jgi:hypothetical protein
VLTTDNFPPQVARYLFWPANMAAALFNCYGLVRFLHFAIEACASCCGTKEKQSLVQFKREVECLCNLMTHMNEETTIRFVAMLPDDSRHCILAKAGIDEEAWQTLLTEISPQLVSAIEVDDNVESTSTLERKNGSAPQGESPFSINSSSFWSKSVPQQLHHPLTPTAVHETICILQ